MTDDPVGVRIQRMPIAVQTLILASIVSARSEEGTFTGQGVTELFRSVALPPPARIADILRTLKRNGLATPAGPRGEWRITPLGRQQASEVVGEEAPALLAESRPGGAQLAHAVHMLIPASLAPSQLVGPVGSFTAKNPSANNVFGMTRFPDQDDDKDGPDPVATALKLTADSLNTHGLRFLLASQRALVDDLWGNVSAHMWASNYGIAFFEDRRGRGMNYNLVIEVGAMLMAGRRCLLLKDSSIDRMPTDLVGHIYKSVDLDDAQTVVTAVHEWVREDLALGSCDVCTAWSGPKI